MTLEACDVSYVSVALVAGDPSDVRDAEGNGRASFPRRIATVLRASPAALVARGADYPLAMAAVKFVMM